MTNEQEQALARVRSRCAMWVARGYLLGSADTTALLAIIDGLQNGYDLQENPPENGQEVLLEWADGVRVLGTYDGEDFQTELAMCPRRSFSRWWPLPKRKERTA